MIDDISTHTRTSYSSKQLLTSLATLLSLIISRIVRRWNQTGQKLAGEPDIAKTFLRSHNQLLWTLTILTYVYFSLKTCHWRAGSRGIWLMTAAINTYSLLTGIAFKVAFTAADAPELLVGVPSIEWIRDLLSDYTLATLARSVFLGIFASSLIPIAMSRTRSSSRQQFSGKFDFQNLYYVLTKNSRFLPPYDLHHPHPDPEPSQQYSVDTSLLFPTFHSQTTFPHNPRNHHNHIPTSACLVFRLRWQQRHILNRPLKRL